MVSFVLDQREQVRQVPLRIGDGGAWRIGFALRRLVDLPLATRWRFLRPRLETLRGDVLDIGVGDSPHAPFLPPLARQTCLTLAENRSNRAAIPTHAFDGRRIAFADKSFDHILCSEVLEHSRDPEAMVREMLRVLRPGGSLLVTVPFSARVHNAPHDYHRFTLHRLRHLFAECRTVEISPRGNDVAVIANKLIVLCMRLARPSLQLPMHLPLLLFALPLAWTFLGIAHATIAFGWGSKDDPLGYAIAATKR